MLVASMNQATEEREYAGIVVLLNAF